MQISKLDNTSIFPQNAQKLTIYKMSKSVIKLKILIIQNHEINYIPG